MADTEDWSTAQKCALIIEAIEEKKGKDIVHIDLREVDHAICEDFIICHGDSTTQVDAIANSVRDKMKEESGIRPHHMEGLQNSQWVLIDYFDVLVHVFLDDFRSFYRLEELWADGRVSRKGGNN